MTKAFDPTKPVQTRDGRKARILCTDFKDVWPIVAAVTTNTDIEVIRYYREGGLVARNCGPMSAMSALTDSLLDPDDLINIPERTSLWFNLYEPDLICGGYQSKDICNLRNKASRLTVLEIVYEDGKPVDVKLHKDEK